MIKKFLTLAVVAALFVACGEEKPTPTPNPGGGNNTEEPEEPEEPAFQSAVQIDGEFADWDALEAGKVFTATLPEGEVVDPVLKTIKIYPDEMYIHVYAEFDPRGEYITETESWSGVRMMDIFIDTDNDPTTGRYYAWYAGADIMMQGAFNGTTTPFNPGVDLYTGPPAAGDWSWEDLGVYGAVETAILPVVVSEDVAKFECSLSRYAFPFEMGEIIAMGIIVETEDWSSVGQLPQDVVPPEGEEAGETDPANPQNFPGMLVVILPPLAE